MNCYIRQRNSPNFARHGFSFLELMIVSLIFTLGILGIFPLLQSIRTNQHDLVLRFNALQLAHKELYLARSFRLEEDTVEQVDFKGDKYLVKKNVESFKGYDRVEVMVEYIFGKNSGSVSLATNLCNKADNK